MAPEPQDRGADSPPGPAGNSPPSPQDQHHDLPPPANPSQAVVQEDASGHHSTTVVESRRSRWCWLGHPQTLSSVPPQALEPCSKGPSSSPPGGSLPPQKSSSIPRVALQSYRDALSSFEAVSGSSSKIGQLEGELKALKEEKAREEGVLRLHLKNLSSEQSVLQERHGATVHRAGNFPGRCAR
ncbi:hypothetical protein LIER_37294 [Lithospermum erythrorhizon]|uniref:Uncharacterized protein n=1 Tax=Lithospermum erythrorhizon TaxID=34254 RepID=A0AAV3PML4_LITER